MRLLKYYRYDLVSLILLILFIAGGIRLIIDEQWLGGLLLVAALFNIYMVRERGLFIERVQYHLRNDPNKLYVLGIPTLPPFPKKRKKNWFEILVLILIAAGSILTITLAVISILRG